MFADITKIDIDSMRYHFRIGILIRNRSIARSL